MGKIQVISTRLILGLLSNYKLDEFYQYIFNLSIDHNNCITKLRLQSTLSKLNEFTTYIYETASFGTDAIYVAVNDCFSNVSCFLTILSYHNIFYSLQVLLVLRRVISFYGQVKTLLYLLGCQYYVVLNHLNQVN